VNAFPRPSSDSLEGVVLDALDRLADRPTIEDERLLQAVRECTIPLTNGLADASSAELGVRLALRLIVRLGARYVGEARRG